MSLDIVHDLADGVHAIADKGRQDLAWIESTLARDGAAGLDKVRAALRRIEGYFSAAHAGATAAKTAAVKAATVVEQKAKPTIAELESILNSGDSRAVNINPDGTVTVTDPGVSIAIPQPTISAAAPAVDPDAAKI